jgi:hypothetical protein
MAISWLAVLKLVPWTDVINNAPVVANGAKKLWKAVAKKSPETAVDADGNGPALVEEPATLAQLQAQLAALQTTVNDLHQQMLASTELINALAEQNTQLIERVEINRIRGLWLIGVCTVTGVVAFMLTSRLVTL